MKKIFVLFVIISLSIGLNAQGPGENVFQSSLSGSSSGIDTLSKYGASSFYPDYVIQKSGSTIYATPKPGSNLNFYSDTTLAWVLQKCINKLTSGGEIYIRKGFYLMVDSIRVSYDNITIRGDGMYNGTKLKFRANYDHFPRTSDHNTSMFWTSSIPNPNQCNYFTLKDIEFDGNADNQFYQWENSNAVAKSHFINQYWPNSWMARANYLKMERVYVHDFTQYGLDMVGSNGFRVIDCHFKDNRENNFNISDSCTNGLISRTISEGSGSVGIAITGGSYQQGGGGIEVRDCIQQPSANWTPMWGIEFIRDAYYCKFINNTIIGGRIGAGGVKGKEMYVGFGNSGGGTGLHSCDISGNTFENITGTFQTVKAITLQNDSFSRITDNHISRVFGYGIQLLGCQYTTVSNNSLYTNNNNADGGIKLMDNDAATIHTSNCFITNNNIYWYADGIVMGVNSTNNWITNNIIKTTSGPDISRNITCTGNIFSGNYGSRVSGSYILLEGAQNGPSENTAMYTIGYPGATGMNFTWTSAGNSTQQNLDIGTIIPANARVTAVEIKCTQTLAGTGLTDMTIGTGNVSAGAQFITGASSKTSGTYLGISDNTKLIAVATNSSTSHIWISGIPVGAFWSAMTAGKWTVYVTYKIYN